MDLAARLEALCELAEEIGIEVRAEPMGGNGGGLCELRGRRVLFVDTAADLATRYDHTLAALAPLTELDQRYLAPEMRDDLERQRKENLLEIREETVNDHEAIREVHRRAFGCDDEAQLVDRLRHDGCVVVSLVAAVGDSVEGHILFSDLPIETDRGVIHAAALAPMAVMPERQRQGIGSGLLRAGLEECKGAGRAVVVVLGHPEYYRRFGFRAELTKALKAPFSGEAFMAIELVPGALKGVAGTVKYPKAFEVL